MESINTPQYAQISNIFMKTNDNSQCNPFGKSNNFGNYFQQCSKDQQSALWGSNKPVQDNCMKPQEGIPCHNIWNNQTRRKGVVQDNRK